MFMMYMYSVLVLTKGCVAVLCDAGVVSASERGEPRRTM